tara:strand:+ start:1940 stop:2842 length:903 start_codon:yes stop_codon:yes gene_type:complete
MQKTILILSFIFMALPSYSLLFANDKCGSLFQTKLQHFESLLPRSEDPDGMVTTSEQVPLSSPAIIEAYRHGAFPWNPTADGSVKWYNPPKHGYMELEKIALRSGKKFRHLRHAMNKADTKGWRVTFNQSFEQVIKACAEHYRKNYSHVWLTSEVQAAFTKLHKEGWAHSVEVWNKEGDLIGGTYGIYIEGVFSGESMFNHNVRVRLEREKLNENRAPEDKLNTIEIVDDAGKVAVLSLADLLYQHGHRIMDTQTVNDNTRSNYKALEVPREDYLRLVRQEREAYLKRGAINPFLQVSGD